MPPDPNETQDQRRPRTPQGRLRANYEQRLDAARDALEAAEEKFDRRRMTPAMAKLDEVYVSGAPVRSNDRDVIRLRKAQRRSVQAATDYLEDAAET